MRGKDQREERWGRRERKDIGNWKERGEMNVRLAFDFNFFSLFSGTLCLRVFNFTGSFRYDITDFRILFQ